MKPVRERLTYANVTATLALFIALGGTSYAVLQVESDDVVDNSLRSRDLRNNSVTTKDVRNRTLRQVDIRRNALGGLAIKESTLSAVRRALEADRVGGKTADDLRVRCPAGTIATADICIEVSGRPAESFLAASSVCDQLTRGLPTMPELQRFAGSHGPLAAEGEWTSSVYLEPPTSSTSFERLEALVLRTFGDVDHTRVNAPNPHPFRCVALPSN